MDLTALEWSFWITLFLLFYTYAGYPLLLWFWAKLHRVPASSVASEPLPSVSVIVVAYNEAERIRARIENLLAQKYPADRFELIIASDGSSDNTVAAARELQSSRVRVEAFSERRGKPSVLNDVVPTATGDIVLLADARQRFHPEAMRSLVDHLGDQRIGAVSGELRYVENHNLTGVGRGIGFYWHYEKFLRRMESRIDSTVGVTGAIYAFRRELFRPLPPETLLDDVLLPMQIVRQGYRVTFDSSAVALDEVCQEPSREFLRKVRTLAGNFQLFGQQGWMLNPFQNRLWWQTFSHKLMRLAGPPLLVLALVLNILLATQPLYALLLFAQVLFYCAALLGSFHEKDARKPVYISIPYTFCLLNMATVVGCMRYLQGRQKVTWKSTSS